MSGLSEAALHVQAMRFVCKALADREQQAIEVDWDVLRHMLNMLETIFRGIEDQRADDADEIETLRKELANAQRAASDEFAERQVLTVEQQQDAAAWQQQVDSANAEVSYLRARLDEERSVSAGLRQLLDAAHSDYALAQSGTLLHRLDMANATILAQKAGNQYLRLLIDKVRGIVGRDDAMSERLEQISQALDEFDRGTIEPTPCPECERLRAELTTAKDWASHCEEVRKDKSAELGFALEEVERLQAFVATVRRVDDAWGENENVVDYVLGLQSALAELDGEPTPVAEPIDG